MTEEEKELCLRNLNYVLLALTAMKQVAAMGKNAIQPDGIINLANKCEAQLFPVINMMKVWQP